VKHQLVSVLLGVALLNCCGGGNQSVVLSIAGRWSGVFRSSNASIAPFTVMATINEDNSGVLTATASFLNFPCLAAASLKGTITGMKVTFAGSDSAGDSATLEGTSNTAGTQMSLSYVVNGGASGKCETDNGTGTLTKQ
jgi:hypothetical protein